MACFFTLLGCSLFSLAMSDADAGQPFTAFYSSAGLAEEVPDLLAESSNTDYGRVERQTYTNLGYAYQPLATAYQPEAPVYQPSAPAAPAYTPSAPAAPAYTPYNSYDIESPTPDVETVVPPVVEAVTPIPEDPLPTFADIFGYNLGEKIKRDADAVLSYLATLSDNSNALVFLNDLISTNPCISSLEGTIKLLQRGSDVIVKAAPELEKLLETGFNLGGERNVTVLVGASADILEQLNDLFPKLESFSFLTRCRVGSDEGVASLRDLAQILYRMSLIDDPKFTTPIKESLLRSAIVTEASTNFLQRIQKSNDKRDCFAMNDFLKEGTEIISEMIEGGAEMLGVLGYLPAAKQARAYAAFTRSTADSLKKLDSFSINIDCGPDALLEAASSMRDLANIVGEVGLEALAVELGVVFRLDLLP